MAFTPSVAAAAAALVMILMPSMSVSLLVSPLGRAASQPRPGHRRTAPIAAASNPDGFGVSERTSVALQIMVPGGENGDGAPADPPSPTSLRPGTLLRFVAPTLALWIAPPVMSLIDTSVVGRICGATELAALSPACTLIDGSAYLFFFIATAATNLVASARAAGDVRGAERTTAEATFLAISFGVALTAVTLAFGRSLLSAIAGASSLAVVPAALRYSSVRALGQPAVLAASVARAAALTDKDTRGPLISVAIAFVLNAIGTVWLVHRTGSIVGAAVGTTVADYAAMIYLFARMARKKTGALPLVVVPTLPALRRFAKYAAPIFFTLLGKSVVYNGVGLSVGRLGPTALAAHQVLLRSFFFWTPVGDSVGMTSQVFLPGILEEERKTGRPATGAKKLLYGLGVVAGGLAALLAGWLPSGGSFLFTKDAVVAAALKQTAPVLAVSVLWHAIALTTEGMLLALQDLKFLSVSYVVTTVATAAFLLSPYRPATLGAAWWILALFQGSRAIQFSLRAVWISGRPVKDAP